MLKWVKLMQKRGLWQYARVAVVAALVVLAVGAGTAFAETSNSSNYQVIDTQFNAGTMDACSGSYCARASIGDPAAGTSTAPASTAQFGTVTDSEPLLEVIVDAGVTNLGVLDTEHTATKTSIVRVRNHLSNGYIIQVVGDPPKYKNHVMATSSSPAESSLGVEQFGINAVANTVPSVGADPVQVPSSEFSFGYVEAGYGTPNRFKYSSGDIVARSDKASGRTDFTLSMIVNVSNMTPAGHFQGEYSVVVTPVY